MFCMDPLSLWKLAQCYSQCLVATISESPSLVTDNAYLPIICM